MTVRTRFAPSPTGYLHIGGARATLFNALFAAKHQGVFILRIEDTDVSRSDEQYAESQQEDIHWLGIHWQEGPGVNGHYGPYWQSQRSSIYHKYYRILEEHKQIYPCFCTDQELMLARKLQLSRGQAPRYSGLCRKLSADELASRLSSGAKHAWRFIVPNDVTITFTDLVKGPQQFQSNDIGDFIVRRADGTAPFFFSNAIDDATMEVTHVLRGEDHLANTPRQILLFQALQLSIPQYGHLSLIVGDDGTPLSKRHGSYSLKEMREHGYLPMAIINYLARLGHASEVQSLLPLDQLAQHFYVEKLSRSPARFDQTQLMYWQKLAVQQMSTTELWRWFGETVADQVPESERSLFAQAIQANIEFPQDALIWAKILYHDKVPLNDKELTIIREAGEQFFVEAEQAIDKYGIDLEQVLQDMKKTLKLSGKKLFMPLRVALTGKTHGPELAHIAKLLGQKKMKHRVGRAFKEASR